MLHLIIFLLPSIIFGEMTEEAKNQILQLHNNYRKMEGATNMFKLEWDDELATKAESWANNCVYEHSGMGENLAWRMTPPHITLTTEKYIKLAIDGWVDEKLKHSYGSEDCQRTESCHYTQVVWHDSIKIGCAYKRCANLKYALKDVWWIVCEYEKPANVHGEKEFRIGGPACSHSDCKGLTCEDGLCINVDRQPPIVDPDCKDYDERVCKKYANANSVCVGLANKFCKKSCDAC